MKGGVSRRSESVVVYDFKRVVATWMAVRGPFGRSGASMLVAELEGERVFWKCARRVLVVWVSEISFCMSFGGGIVVVDGLDSKEKFLEATLECPRYVTVNVKPASRYFLRTQKKVSRGLVGFPNRKSYRLSTRVICVPLWQLLQVMLDKRSPAVTSLVSTTSSISGP